MLIVGGNQSAGGYEVDNSLRFDDGSSDYLTKTFGSAGNRKTWTWSGWVKRSSGLGSQQTLFGTSSGATTFHLWYLSSNDTLTHNYNTTYLETNAKFRDTSAWYHFVCAVDTTQATASDRVKIYVNGVQETSFSNSGYPSQNTDMTINNNVRHDVGNSGAFYTHYFDGYMSEVVFIDGTALDPTSFGEFDEDSGIWKPIDVSGLTFGTNGFYLPFENSAALGQDDSGNGNNFTVNNLTSIDQTTDTPTNNSATINILTPVDTTVSEGNLEYSDTSSNFKGVVGTFGASSGKWYCEIKVVTVGDAHHVGIVDVDQQQGAVAEYPGNVSNGYSLSNERDVFNNGGIISGYTDWTGTYTSGDIMGIAMDLDNNKLYFSKGGQWSDGAGSWGSTTFNPATGDVPINSGITYTFSASAYNGTGQFNFGSPPFTISSGNSDGNGYGNFEYAVPSGYYALNTKNLAEYG